MVASMDHLGHVVSTAFLLLLWVVSYLGIRRVTYQTIGDPSRQVEEVHHGRHRSRRLGSLHAESVVQPRRLGRYIVRARCVVAVVARNEEEAV